jgi:hypothetical protein
MPTSINLWGAIAGNYIEAVNTVHHGFVRDMFHRITVFDAPEAGTATGQGTYAMAINPQGVVTGYYIDANGVNHGFVRDIFGRLRTFDAPDAGTGTGQGTFPASINPAGVIVGWYTDNSNASHGFLLTP